jgi:predicted dehydrogenase
MIQKIIVKETIVKNLKRESIGVGVVGTGLMGVAHTNALRENGIQVHGILGSRAEKAQIFAKDMSIDRVYESFDDMLADETIEVIHLTTPNHLHYVHAKAALLAGKHVACEKPLTMNPKESRELFVLAKEKNLVNAVNFNVRMYPMVQKARSMVQNGEIGDLFIIQGAYLQDWLLYPTDWNWRLDPKMGGQSRTVGDIGSHWIDLVSYISGLRITEVFADFKTFHQKRIVPTHSKTGPEKNQSFSGENQEFVINSEDYASILFHFEEGVQGVLTLSQMCAGHKNKISFNINASQSSLIWNGEKAEELWVGHRDEPNHVFVAESKQEIHQKSENDSSPEFHNQVFSNTFNELYRRVYQYLLEGDYSRKPDFPTFEDGHYGMLVLEAIEASAREKSWKTVGLENLKQ